MLTAPLGVGGFDALAMIATTVTQPPNSDLLELFYRYAPDQPERQKILVTNPAKLFGFPV